MIPLNGTAELVLPILGRVSITAALVGLSYLTYNVIYCIFFHPLAKYDGPLLAKFSYYYMIKWELQQNRVLGSAALLEKYGSPVRIAPNELMFAEEKAYMDIYGQGPQPCLKDPMFDNFTWLGVANVLNVRDRARHNELRRLMNPSFSVKSVASFQPVMAQVIRKYVDDIFGAGARLGDPFETLEHTRGLFLDIISQLCFARFFDRTNGEHRVILDAIRDFSIVVPMCAIVPAFKRLPIKWLQEAIKNCDTFEQVTRRSILDYQNRYDVDQRAEYETLLHTLLTTKDKETKAPLVPLNEVVDNTLIFLLAGTDTSSLTVCSLLWEAGRHPQVWQRLTSEIRAAFPNQNVMPTYEKASKLVYLKCVFEETLRLRGPLNTARSSRMSPGKMIGQHYIPAGTIVYGDMRAAARDPVTFPEPEKFLPERWLNMTSSMRNMSRPFLFGPHHCLGKYLAEAGVLITIARIAQCYDVTVDENMMEAMEIKDVGFLCPKGEKVIVRAVAVESK